MEKALRRKKRQTIPNPNKRFIRLAGHTNDEPEADISARISDEIVVASSGVESESDDDRLEEPDVVPEADLGDEGLEEEPPTTTTRSGRTVKRRRCD